MYENKSKSITYFYHCSQWEGLAKKIKKHPDSQKHRDRQSMHRYTYNSCINITIFEDLASSNIEIKHFLHPKKADISISPEIKQFILNNIDLLPREIYKRLVEQGLDINIRQKQVHFWWSELGKKKYKRDNDPFSSAQKWFEKKSYYIIFQKDNPKALGFLTNFWDVLKNSQFKVSEIGIDATCKYHNYQLI
jgi:hypothetical protein